MYIIKLVKNSEKCQRQSSERESNMIQQRLMTKQVKYSFGSYNKYDHKEQWIRLSEGCPHNCPYCYEPQEIKVFDVPEIVRNTVKIMDMNILCKPEALNIIEELGTKRVNGKMVYYEFVCGIDYRFLTQEVADALHKNRFGRFNKKGVFYKGVRIAWDWLYKDQLEIRDAVKMLIKAGFKPNSIMIFMICNWRIPFLENCKKLDLCKVWNVQVADCYFDNQTHPNVIPEFWNTDENDLFRDKCRKHNQLVNYGIDPEEIMKQKQRYKQKRRG